MLKVAMAIMKRAMTGQQFDRMMDQLMKDMGLEEYNTDSKGWYPLLVLKLSSIRDAVGAEEFDDFLLSGITKLLNRNAFDKFDPTKAKLKTYVIEILRRAVINEYTVYKRRTRPTEDITSFLSEKDLADIWEEDRYHSRDFDLLREALIDEFGATSTRGDLDVPAPLLVFEGLTQGMRPAEISRVLGISKGYVSKVVRKIRSVATDMGLAPNV